MILMGRPKTTWQDLPPRMTARRLRSGKTLYYYQSGGKKTPLGPDRIEANKEWARLEAGQPAVTSFPHVTRLYREAMFQTFRLSTKKHYEIALTNLDVAFASFSLEQIEPKHVKSYMRRRSKKGAAVFEKRVGSTFFNWAREEGHTAAANPFRGVKFSAAEKRAYNAPEGKRKRYVTDEEFEEVYTKGDAIL